MMPLPLPYSELGRKVGPRYWRTVVFTGLIWREAERRAKQNIVYRLLKPIARHLVDTRKYYALNNWLFNEYHLPWVQYLSALRGWENGHE